MRWLAVLLVVMVLWMAPDHQGYSARVMPAAQRAVAARVLDRREWQ